MDPHPYGQAFADGDLDGLREMLAEDVVFHSPVIRDPGFEGRESVLALLEMAFRKITVEQYTHQFADQDVHVFIANGRVLGKPVKTTTLIETNGEGQVREIWVMARPLTGLVAIAEAIGGEMVERRYPGRGGAIRALSRPLAGMAAVANATGGRLIAELNRSTG